MHRNARPVSWIFSHSLRMRAFNPCMRGILFPKLRGLLLYSSRLQSLMRWLRQQMHHPASTGGMRAVLARGTGDTGLEGEPRFDAVSGVEQAPLMELLRVSAPWFHHLLLLSASMAFCEESCNSPPYISLEGSGSTSSSNGLPGLKKGMPDG